MLLSLCTVITAKRLVEAQVNYDKITDVKASYIGVAYYAENPALNNPVDWYRVVTAAAIIITAMATALALFIACKTGNLN